MAKIAEVSKKDLMETVKTVVEDMTPEMRYWFNGLLVSMMTTEDSPVKSKKGKASDDSPDSPEDSPEESPEEDSPEDSPEESPEEDSPEESPEEDSPEDSPEESPEEDSPVKSKKTSKSSTKKTKASPEEEEEVNFSKMNEKKLIAYLTEENIDPTVFKAIKKDKTKLLKLAKAYNKQVEEFKGQKLSKLEKLRDKNELKVSFGRGRSSDEKKIGLLAKALAVHGLTE